jgi:hypothetical protein
MGQRRDRLDNRLAVAKVTRERNSLKKVLETGRREKCMLSILKQGKLPYTPGVMSWLSDQTGKKASQISAEDVQSLLQ